MNHISVADLTGAQESLLIPLWARAVESQRDQPILHDPKAVEMVARIDYDFDRFVRSKTNAAGYCVRARIFDDWVRSFLNEHADGSVVEFGPGLDTRFDRVDNGSVSWFEVDLPKAIQVRRRFFEESERRRFVAASATDPDWIKIVQQSRPKALLFLAEGVFYFLQERQIQQLFTRVADHFPGSRFIFDSQSPLFLLYSRLAHPLKNSTLLWGLSHAEQIERWDPRFRVEEWIGFGDPRYYGPHMQRFPKLYRWVSRLYPGARNMFRVTRVRLGERSD